MCVSMHAYACIGLLAEASRASVAGPVTCDQSDVDMASLGRLTPLVSPCLQTELTSSR